MKSKTILSFFSWFAVWITGCIIFDLLLGLKGGWLMGAGVLTYWSCEFVQKAVEK